MNKVFLLCALALAGCGAAPAAAPPLAGATIGGAFALTDQDGHPRTDRDFTGKWRIMYFGYTYCPDVCPTEMATIAAALRKVEATDPARAAAIVPVFVTVDPARDTPAVLKPFVAAFHPRTVGLTGSPDAIARIEKDYAVYAKRGATSPAGGYMMDHSRQAYLMDPNGKPVALLSQDEGADAVAAELNRWVAA